MANSSISNSRGGRYDNINALRAISAIGIAMMHYLANLKQTPDMGWIGSILIPWFTQFVFLFFIISGFGLCCGYYERIKTGAITPNDFYAKRYKRILPFFALLIQLRFYSLTMCKISFSRKTVQPLSA